MMNTLPVALITGASRGIGASIAKRLASDGYAVVINYANSAAKAEQLVEEIEQQGGQAVSIQADVANSESVNHLFDEVKRRFGRLDVLVNNAGIMALAPVSQTSDQHYQSHIDTNLTGTFNTLRCAASHMNEGGRIINMSTSVVGLKMANYGVYAATKAAVETLSAIFAKELAGRQITVNCVAPGPTATELFLDGKPPSVIEHLSSLNPLGRLGQPEDIANVVAFLAGTDGQWVNGQVLRANGGMI
ncbi:MULTISPECIES: SDR family oxidoreductase [unclassified Vibrio]|uniref:SDR family oxidoreductase n=1 Tax=Vibrio sp. HB236076 TaxID=3232307 RepID=A0AB39HH58_9VIBR|nr:SDR family oxidoreductase [Vibrio sp. HB161653]MDP5254450.1 SDR family oxidoreductase [Vibrio sp. HB161653]